MVLAWPASAQPFSTLPNGYIDTTVFSGLSYPTALRFSRDGRVFVAEKSGRILVYSGLGDRAPTIFADLSTEVHNYWDRGLLGLELDPDFPNTPYVYVLYTHDAAIGGTAPRWGTPGILSDSCPTPPGPNADGCVVSGRLSRLTASGDVMSGTEKVLIEDWCQQYPSHSIGDIRFGPDGALYASGGDGASFGFADYGQKGDPLNPCGDPPAGVGGAETAPSAEGGALRSEDLRTRSDPTGLNGSIIRVNPSTGTAWPTNPLALDPDLNARRILAEGLRNPFRIAFRPGTGELWIGDVGWNSGDEVDRLASSSSAVTNFGWPCYEGSSRQVAYDALDLTLCETLYASPGAVTAPLFSYGHNDHIVVDDYRCHDGGSAVAGLAFYQGTSYPGRTGTLFVADNARQCIWTMAAGADGAPDPSQRAIFATGLSSPVALEIGPGGDVYYVDFFAGRIGRIRYVAGNHPPTAVATASPAAGPKPLVVQFEGRKSSDPEDPTDTLTFNWDFNDDGWYDSSEPAPTQTFTKRGTYTVRLRVTDALGESAETTTTVSVANSPPVASIDLPVSERTWHVGETVTFAGSATDPDEGGLGPSRLSWRLLLYHCQPTCHRHIIEMFSGAGGSFVAPDHDYPSYLELELTASDDQGVTDVVTRPLDPETTDLWFKSEPAPGFELVVGTELVHTPFLHRAIVGATYS
ncbi:MAG: PQQ-dependent sugar dehydrogenase, partial [Candidatus Dormibacteraeota bacterium]|nr:PQQ-dependent sugar dehydrogenase [Candidatus Dormibacteraeota bacterium]